MGFTSSDTALFIIFIYKAEEMWYNTREVSIGM